MRRIPALLPLVLAACGGISNLPLEDLAFVDALPKAQELALAAPDEAALSQGLQAEGRRVDGLAGRCDRARDGAAGDAFCLGHELVREVNRMTAGLLGVLDLVRSLPPTERSDDGRVWGPHSDDEHPGRRWKVGVQRHDGGASFSWEISFAQDDGPFVIVVAGAFEPGPGGTSRGAGWYLWDAKAARDAGFGGVEEDPDSLELRYDLLVEPRRLNAQITGNGQTLELDHERASDGAGAWEYVVPVDLDGLGALDLLQASMRWQADRAGRADAHLTLGEGSSGPPGPYGTSVCWAQDFTRTFVRSDFRDACPEGGCEQGDEGDCVFAPLL